VRVRRGDFRRVLLRVLFLRVLRVRRRPAFRERRRVLFLRVRRVLRRPALRLFRRVPFRRVRRVFRRPALRLFLRRTLRVAAFFVPFLRRAFDLRAPFFFRRFATLLLLFGVNASRPRSTRAAARFLRAAIRPLAFEYDSDDL